MKLHLMMIALPSLGVASPAVLMAMQQEPIAHIEAIAEGKNSVDSTTLKRGLVIRTNQQKEAPRVQQPLYGQNEVETFSNTRMAVRYRSDKKQLLILDSNQKQVIEKPGFFSLLKGRVLALIEGRFEIGTPHVVVGVEGTDFLVEVNDDRTRVTVFDGLVSYRMVRNRSSNRHRRIESKAYLGASKINVNRGQSIRQTLSLGLTNNCETPQQFRVRGFENLKWVRQESPGTVTVAPGQEEHVFYFQVDATSVPAGIYMTSSQVDCISCKGKCRPRAPTLTARRIEVHDPSGERMTIGPGTQIDFKVGKPGKPKKVTDKKARQLRKRFEDLIPKEHRQQL